MAGEVSMEGGNAESVMQGLTWGKGELFHHLGEFRVIWLFLWRRHAVSLMQLENELRGQK